MTRTTMYPASLLTSVLALAGIAGANWLPGTINPGFEPHAFDVVEHGVIIGVRPIIFQTIQQPHHLVHRLFNWTVRRGPPTSAPVLARSSTCPTACSSPPSPTRHTSSSTSRTVARHAVTPVTWSSPSATRTNVRNRPRLLSPPRDISRSIAELGRSSSVVLISM